MSDAKTETAFVLPAEAVEGAGGPVHFGGFPGVWFPDQPVAVSELGFATVAAARDARKQLAPDLVEKTVKTGSAPMPVQENHIPAAATAAEAEETIAEALVQPEPSVEEGAAE